MDDLEKVIEWLEDDGDVEESHLPYISDFPVVTDRFNVAEVLQWVNDNYRLERMW